MCLGRADGDPVSVLHPDVCGGTPRGHPRRPLALQALQPRRLPLRLRRRRPGGGRRACSRSARTSACRCPARSRPRWSPPSTTTPTWSAARPVRRPPRQAARGAAGSGLPHRALRGVALPLEHPRDESCWDTVSSLADRASWSRPGEFYGAPGAGTSGSPSPRPAHGTGAAGRGRGSPAVAGSRRLQQAGLLVGRGQRDGDGARRAARARGATGGDGRRRCRACSGVTVSAEAVQDAGVGRVAPRCSCRSAPRRPGPQRPRARPAAARSSRHAVASSGGAGAGSARAASVRGSVHLRGWPLSAGRAAERVVAIARDFTSRDPGRSLGPPPSRGRGARVLVWRAGRRSGRPSRRTRGRASTARR